MIPKPKRHVDKKLISEAKNLRCVACNRMGAEFHHVKTKKSGGNDETHNLMPLDRICHTKIHKIGTTKFAEENVFIRNWLLSHGWYFCEVRNKWVNDLNNKG